jgi:hypothetical protein
MHTVVTKFCFASVSTVLLAALASCGGGSTASKQHVLHSLRSCLGHLATGVKSPCIGMDVSQLSGISRNELVAALGPPSFCHPTSSTALLTADCAPAKRPVWSFARVPQKRVGGDIELVCQSDDDTHCARLVWLAGE